MASDSHDVIPPDGERERRTDPVRNGRRLAWYFGGLLVVYVAATVAFWPSGGADPNPLIFVVVMVAPTVGALLARYLGPGVIQWGRLSWWTLAGLIPAAAVLGVYLAGVLLGWDADASSVFPDALTTAGVSILGASLLALGEEIGWRGFLWPLLRRRQSYLWTSLLIGVIWWLYHVPFVIFGWYGSVGGLPAFTVSLAGFTLFVGAVTDRSKSVWPSVVAHGAWNALVATSIAASESGVLASGSVESTSLTGEFGWIPAMTMLIVGVGTAWWHLRWLSVRREAG